MMHPQAIMHTAFATWPGALRLWYRGDAHALILSVLFGMLLNIAWTATFVWPMWISAWKVDVLWAILFLGVVVSSLHTWIVGAYRAEPTQDAKRDQALVVAQELYLQANYFDAEKLLQESLRQSSNDVESGLLLVSIYRRTSRFSQALELIQQLERLDRAGPWLMELRAEKQQCLRSRLQTPSVSPPAHS